MKTLQMKVKGNIRWDKIDHMYFVLLANDASYVHTTCIGCISYKIM